MDCFQALELLMTGSNSIYYTEDQIPIRTLYVSQLSNKTTDRILKEYFKVFGVVEKTRIHRAQNFTYAFVTFSKAEEAAKVLDKDVHLIDTRRIRVRDADSWHQPIDKKPEETEPHCTAASGGVAAQSVDANNDSSSILLLNDDCLLHIFSFLSIFDLQAAAKVGPRFQALMPVVYKKYKHFDFNHLKSDHKPTLMDVRNIFTQIGNYIVTLHISADKFANSNRRIIEMIPRFCGNLKGVRIEGFAFILSTMKLFAPLYSQLESLELIRCNVNEQIERSLELSKSLKHLNLSHNSDISGKCLTKIENLKSLNLDNCPHIQSKFFSIVCQNNKTIKYLNISGCDRLNDHNITDMLTNLTALEHLVISNSYSNFTMVNMIKLSKLQSLKKLKIVYTCFENIDRFLNELAVVDQLESLDISGECVSNDALVNMRMFTKLKTLKMRYKTDFDDDTLKRLGDKPSIEEINFTGCCKLTNEGLTAVIRSCKNLQFLDCSGCEHIDFYEFLSDANEYYKELNKTNPLVATSVSRIKNTSLDRTLIKKATVLPKLIVTGGHTNINMEKLRINNFEYVSYTLESTFQPHLIDVNVFENVFGDDGDDDEDDDDDDLDLYDIDEDYDDYSDEDYLFWSDSDYDGHDHLQDLMFI